MSAFVVSHDHIDALLSYAHDKRMSARLSYIVDSVRETPLSWDSIGRILLAENERSVNHRYREHNGGNYADSYKYKYLQQLCMMQHGKKLALILKACDCFDYQACETEDYDQSVAYKIVDAIRSAAIHALPGYDEAPWGIDRDRLGKAA